MAYSNSDVTTPRPHTPTSHDPFASEEDAYRHVDGGPVAELVRSGSGRLPPAYESWRRPPPSTVATYPSDNSGVHSVAPSEAFSGPGSDVAMSEQDLSAPLVPQRFDEKTSQVIG